MNDIISKVLKRHQYAQNQEIMVRAAFKDINSETSIADLYTGYLEAIKQIDHLNELKANCKSDFFYWGYIADIEAQTAIKQIYAELIFSLLDLDDLVELKLAALKAQELDSIKVRIREEIDGLGKYKPNGYKSKIELLNSLLGGNK